MIQYFAKDYAGDPFMLFGPAHLTALGVVILINLSLLFARRTSNHRLHAFIRYTLAGVLVLNRIALHTWNIATGQWSIQWHLPLHLCSIFVWLSAIMLVSKSYTIFEYAYFLGIGGALQPLLTPDAGIYGFPHFYAIQFFISHGAIVTAAVYMAIAEGYRPHWSSIKKVFIWGNIYLLFVTIINLMINSNYLYTLHKPHSFTLLDFLGPWPWYLINAEIIALIIFLILYSPYLLSDRKAI